MRKLISTLLVAVVAACSGPSASVAPSDGPTQAAIATASSLPSATIAPSASTTPTAEPSFAPSFGTPQVIPPGAAIEVAVAELNLRRRPSTTARRLQILKRGDVLITAPADNLALGWGPVKANGYTWYPVMLANVANTDLKLDPLPASPLVFGGEPTAGWIAADDGTQSYVVPVPPRCPATVDLVNVSGMLPAERLACFGEPFTLEGTYGCSGCGGIALGVYKPVWLATPVELEFLSVAPEVQFGPLALRFPPNGPPRPSNGDIIRVTVHVNDPRATRCEITESDGATATRVSKEAAVFYCRERLVVESYVILGTDADFPSG